MSSKQGTGGGSNPEGRRRASQSEAPGISAVRQVEAKPSPSFSKKNPTRLKGRTRYNKIVVFDGSPQHCGRLLDVKIQRAGTFTLYGTVEEAH